MGGEDRQIDRLDSAVRTLCTSCCICRKTQVQPQQQQQQQQQQQRRGLCSSHSIAVAVEATTGVFKLKETVTMNELLFPVVHLSLVVVMLSMCSPVESIVYDSHWSSFAVLCLVHFVGSLVWPHRFRHRISNYTHVHPMRQIAETQKLSAATSIIYGLALGYLSTIIPVVSLGITILVAHYLCGIFGVAMGALGMLGTLTMGLTIDAFGPISDNAGGIAEMSQLDEWVRERTDVLDAAENTTEEIGKGFAIGSAALVSLAQFGAFCVRADITGVDILHPWVFTGMLFGAMMPYAFAAPAPVVEYIAPAPAVLYAASAQVVEYLTPAPHGMSQVEVIFDIDAHRNRLPMNWEVELCDRRDVLPVKIAGF